MGKKVTTAVSFKNISIIWVFEKWLGKQEDKKNVMVFIVTNHNAVCKQLYVLICLT